jgi:hypothetical protein
METFIRGTRLRGLAYSLQPKPSVYLATKLIDRNKNIGINAEPNYPDLAEPLSASYAIQFFICRPILSNQRKKIW